MKYLFLILIALPGASFSCNESDAKKMWYFRTFTNTNNTSNSVENKSDGKLTINAIFIDELITKPSIQLFDTNRYELFYLVSKNNFKAELAGLKSLALLLRNPKYVIESDSKVAIYNIPEVAHTLSRSSELNKAYCKLSKEEQMLVSKYYQLNPSLFQVDIDAPWDYNSCG